MVFDGQAVIIIIPLLVFAHICPILILAPATLQHEKKKKKRKQELNKDSLSTSKTFGFRHLLVPFKAILFKNVYAAKAFLLHIKILEKQEKEINASFKIHHCWHSLESVTVILYCVFTFVHTYKICHLILKLSDP